MKHSLCVALLLAGCKVISTQVSDPVSEPRQDPPSRGELPPAFGAASTLILTGNPASALADGHASVVLEASLKDQSGAGIAGESILFLIEGPPAATGYTGPTGPTAPPPPTYLEGQRPLARVDTDTQGVARYAFSSTLRGSKRYYASYGALASSATVTFLPAPKSLRVEAALPPALKSGDALPQVTVTVLDDNGQPFTGGELSVRLTLANSLQMTLLANGSQVSELTATTSHGVATFSNLAVEGSGFGGQLLATAGALSAVSTWFSVSAWRRADGWAGQGEAVYMIQGNASRALLQGYYGLWETTNAGLTWMPYTSGLPYGEASQIYTLAVAADGAVYAVADGALLRADPSEDIFRPYGPLDLNGSSWYEIDVDVTTTPPTVYAVGYAGSNGCNMWRVTETEWSCLTTAFGGNMHLAVDDNAGAPAVVYATDSGQVYRYAEGVSGVTTLPVPNTSVDNLWLELDRTQEPPRIFLAGEHFTIETFREGEPNWTMLASRNAPHHIAFDDSTHRLWAFDNGARASYMNVFPTGGVWTDVPFDGYYVRHGDAAGGAVFGVGSIGPDYLAPGGSTGLLRANDLNNGSVDDLFATTGSALYSTRNGLFFTSSDSGASWSSWPGPSGGLTTYSLTSDTADHSLWASIQYAPTLWHQVGSAWAPIASTGLPYYLTALQHTGGRTYGLNSGDGYDFVYLVDGATQFVHMTTPAPIGAYVVDPQTHRVYACYSASLHSRAEGEGAWTDLGVSAYCSPRGLALDNRVQPRGIWIASGQASYFSFASQTAKLIDLQGSNAVGALTDGGALFHDGGFKLVRVDAGGAIVDVIPMPIRYAPNVIYNSPVAPEQLFLGTNYDGILFKLTGVP